MEYTEWLTDWQIERVFHAKTQRHAQRRKRESNSLCVSFLTLRLCVKRFFGFLVILLLSSPGFAQLRQAMKAADLVRVANVTDAQISPNGQWVVYSVSSVEDDKPIKTLWLARLDLESYSTPIPTPTPRRPAPY